MSSSYFDVRFLLVAVSKCTSCRTVISLSQREGSKEMAGLAYDSMSVYNIDIEDESIIRGPDRIKLRGPCPYYTDGYQKGSNGHMGGDSRTNALRVNLPTWLGASDWRQDRDDRLWPNANVGILTGNAAREYAKSIVFVSRESVDYQVANTKRASSLSDFDSADAKKAFR